jgi:hypothetical protein
MRAETRARKINVDTNGGEENREKETVFFCLFVDIHNTRRQAMKTTFQHINVSNVCDVYS